MGGGREGAQGLSFLCCWGCAMVNWMGLESLVKIEDAKIDIDCTVLDALARHRRAFILMFPPAENC
jgi:hypothetical protein